MKRKVLLITNPGETGEINYCEGVKKDVVNFTRFLSSSIGGLWSKSEIQHLERPSVSSVKECLKELKMIDYSIVIFCGHGYYDQNKDSTILELRKGQEIDSIELRDASPKQSIILDCCRVLLKKILVEERMVKAAFEGASINPFKCKHRYNKRIEECSPGKIVIHSCAIAEEAGDDEEKGGYYSYNLVRVGEKWANKLNINTDTHFSILSLVRAHELAKARVQKLSGNQQNPKIEKQRSEPYFPFCVVA